MIKFFRHIRQNLIMENNTSKYFKYAIGEIVLVVIGILIALQINTWNEQRKLDRDLVNVLKEVRSNLITDSLNIRDTRENKSEDIRIQNKVIHELESGNIPYDSLEHHLGRVMLTRRIVLVDNGYELMKKFGLERLQHAALRDALINYYTVAVERIYEDTRDDDFEFIQVFLPYVRSHFIDWNWNKRGVPADYAHFKNDQYFLTCLKVSIKNHESTLEQLQIGSSQIRGILPMLDQAIATYD